MRIDPRKIQVIYLNGAQFESIRGPDLPKHIRLDVDEMEARVMNQEFDIHKGFIGQRKKAQKEAK